MKTKLLSLAFILVLVSCGKTDKKAEIAKLRKQQAELAEQIKRLEAEVAGDSTNVAKGTRVGITDVAYQDFIHCIEIQGKVDGDESVDVFAEGTGGIIKQILVKEGQYVTKGQVLATIDDKIYQVQLKSNEANLEYVNSLYEKQKALWDQKIGSEVQYLDIKNKKESLESAVETIKEQINMCKIKAPINGTVEGITIKIGQLVGPAIPAFRVVNLSTLKITAEVAEGYSSKVRKGDKVSIYLPDMKKEFNGNVDFDSKYISPVNRTFTVNVRIPSNDKDIKANMVAVVRITDYHNPKAIVVPLNVVQSDLNGQYVFVAQNKTAKKVHITTGEIYAGNIEIKSGLNIGDKVITVGYQELEDGQAINF
ncbi:MAG TPA: efflux RND transporter periplasmic adaptor subunit [Bacteroidales bacterium]|nr:efflux RND transporter periplasmic adaptor subunit [Bacteroidales bacterium]